MGIKKLQEYYKRDFVNEHNTILTSINKEIIADIYNAFKNYVNMEKLEAGEKVSIFSWMNCSVFGRDLNATLNIMKKHFKKDMQNMLYVYNNIS